MISFLPTLSIQFLHSKMKSAVYPRPKSTETQISISWRTFATDTTLLLSIVKVFSLYAGAFWSIVVSIARTARSSASPFSLGVVHLLPPGPARVHGVGENAVGMPRRRPRWLVPVSNLHE